MRKIATRLGLCATLLAGCRPAQEAPFLPPPAVTPTRRAPDAPQRRPQPPERRLSVAFDAVPMPEVISIMARQHKVAITISRTIPTETWSQHRVTLRMADVTVRAFLDWLVRPLEAQYAIEADGPMGGGPPSSGRLGAWLSRSDDLLDDEPLEVRSYRVPTHLALRRPIRGALLYEREQAAVLDTLHACLRYIEERRPGCRLAFHGEQDVLAARLPARAHARLEAILDALRYGSGLPELPRPSALDLRSKLDAPVAWDDPPAPANHTLFRIAEAAGVNLGWDAAPLADRVVLIPAGRHPLREMLDAVVRQTPLGRYAIEPGHGIWLYREGQDADFPSSGATLWDRAVVRAYEVRPVLAHLTPEALLAHVRRQVDPGEWARGLPAASVFAPTGRLIVVHDEAGQRRTAAVVHELVERYRSVPVPTKKGG